MSAGLVKSQPILIHTLANKQDNDPQPLNLDMVIDITSYRFSSKVKLLGVIVLTCVFIEEVEGERWIKMIQLHYFPEELEAVKHSNQVNTIS